jgi:CrcB protein
MIEAGGFLAAAALLAVARSAVIARLNTEGFPWGTLVVNVSGSFAAGLVVSVAPQQWATIVGIAALGAFTTFSTFAVEIAALWSERPGAALGYGAATTVSAVGAATLALGF